MQPEEQRTFTLSVEMTAAIDRGDGKRRH